MAGRSMGTTALLCGLIALLTISHVSALDNGLGRTPPMGWLSWERFRCVTDCSGAFADQCINQDLYMQMADHLVSDGYLSAGYEYVDIDDCWNTKGKSPTGLLQPNATRFPDGIEALAEYMHDRNLKLGIYSDIGNFSCGYYQGLEGHYEADAQLMAEWQVDSIKVDGCYASLTQMNSEYPEFGKALNATGRPILYACSWPDYQLGHVNVSWDLIKKTCNLYRVAGDIQDSWSSVADIITYWATNQDWLAPNHGPGHWNDPDQLIIGDYALSDTESITQMSFWCLWSAPLLMSNDLRAITATQKAILLNTEVIAVDQDPLGKQGMQVWSENALSVWAKEMAGGVYAVVLYNSWDAGTPLEITASFADIPGLSSATKAQVRDLWLHQDMGTFTGSYTALVDPHGVVMITLTPAT